MRLRYHKDSVNEMFDAADYYDSRVAGLGREFDEELKAGFNKILEAPTRWPKIHRDVRRHRLHRFPYGIVDDIEGDSITVIAVMHLKRRPGYWLERIKEVTDEVAYAS